MRSSCWERLRQAGIPRPFWQRVTSERARDAIAAAFLHDIGHGPTSSRRPCPARLATRAGPSASCSIPAPTCTACSSPTTHTCRSAWPISSGKPLPYLAKAVSGTFDVDCCDYLLRDAHATGVRYGEYDLPWLLRSLRFDESAQPGLAPSSTAPRGLAPHRGVPPGVALHVPAGLLPQVDALGRVDDWRDPSSARALAGARRHAAARAARGARVGGRGRHAVARRVPRARRSGAAGGHPRVGERERSHPRRSACASASARAPSSRPSSSSTSAAGYAIPPEEALAAALCEIAAAAGLDPAVYVGLDVAEDTPYADDDSLKVVFPKGRARQLSEVSFLLLPARRDRHAGARHLCAELEDAMREALIR